MTVNESIEPSIQQVVAVRLRESARIHSAVADHSADTIASVVRLIVQSFRSGHKLLLCGNGGSAADAQHLAGEFVGRFLKERRALPAIALTTDTSVLTAIGNDYGIDAVFARQVEALGVRGDVLIAISPSGSSPNILSAVTTARRMGVSTIGLTGERESRLSSLTDYCVRVPSSETPRIQEAHISIGHVICELVEKEIVRDSAVGW